MRQSKQKLPFKEAIEHFRKKQPLPSDGYRDVENEMHDRAFMVAGVAQQEVLECVMSEMDKALAEGMSLGEFKKNIIAKTEDMWIPKQDKGWRARVIYETNMRTAYAAGQYKQMQEDKDLFPYWQYRHGDSKKPRAEHLALDGLVLRADDPFWNTHYPPNGWGCRCYVLPLSEAGLRRRGLRAGTAPKNAPIDPHWAYAPGRQEALWPAASPKGNLKDISPSNQSIWGPSEHPLDNRSWLDYGRPERLEQKKASGSILEKSYENAIEALKEVLGSDQKMFEVTCGQWKLPMVADARRLGGHLPNNRIPFLGLLEDAMQPQEIWAQFIKRTDGKIALRWRMINSVDVRGKQLLLVCEGNNQGTLEAFTFFPVDDKAINRYRVGRLVAHD